METLYEEIDIDSISPKSFRKSLEQELVSLLSDRSILTPFENMPDHPVIPAIKIIDKRIKGIKQLLQFHPKRCCPNCNYELN